MHCGGTFVAPSHFLSTNRDVNLFMYVALMRSLFMVMKHDQDGASLARVVVKRLDCPTIGHEEERINKDVIWLKDL